MKRLDCLTYDERRTTDNSTYKKLAVQWLNEALCIYHSFCLVDSEVLRNRQLLVAANRYLLASGKPHLYQLQGINLFYTGRSLCTVVPDRF
jgi:hypothetical protein